MNAIQIVDGFVNFWALLIFVVMAATPCEAAEQKSGRAEVSDPAAAQKWKPRDADETIERLERISASTDFSSCCFWSWELQLAIIKRDREVAQGIVAILSRLQRPDGRWGLGTDWGKGIVKYNFKRRLAEDAESWDVAEAANALLDYSEVFSDKSVMPRVIMAANYLKQSIRFCEGKPYIPHMAECNNMLQPHSTIATALLFSRLPEFKELAVKLHKSGAEMNFLRILPHADGKTVEPPKFGMMVADFEKVQIGYYLLLLNDPSGRKILDGYNKSDFDNPASGYDQMAGAYIVLAYTKLGEWEKARHFAAIMKDYKPNRGPNRGYKYALKDILDYVNLKPNQAEPENIR